MYDNRTNHNERRYKSEKYDRWNKARNKELPAINALANKIYEKFWFNVSYKRYDSIWFKSYDPNKNYWVRGCSDFYLIIDVMKDTKKIMYVEVKIKDTTFDTTLRGGKRQNQQISNYGCVSYYLDLYVVDHMNEFCERANIKKNSFIVLFINSDFDSIRLISLDEINSLVKNGWNNQKLSTFKGGYGSRSYLIPVDATNDINNISLDFFITYLSDDVNFPE